MLFRRDSRNCFGMSLIASYPFQNTLPKNTFGVRSCSGHHIKKVLKLMICSHHYISNWECGVDHILCWGIRNGRAQLPRILFPHQAPCCDPYRFQYLIYLCGGKSPRKSPIWFLERYTFRHLLSHVSLWIRVSYHYQAHVGHYRKQAFRIRTPMLWRLNHPVLWCLEGQVSILVMLFVRRVWVV